MNRLKPEQEDESSGTSSWVRVQMQESPTLLPTLKFHDLVFGHDLGEGSFGSVKYARLIVKDKTRSHWPEYAVKIVNTKKILEMEYEASIQREIAILRMLSHPGIARLISSFRFHDGAYLVLEYASKGDLHTLLRQHGSLDEESTRFVVGEIVAALASIHDMGLVFVDLKPENILITETGHIKLTDFGGCRPVTEEARKRVRQSGKNLLKQLRDGDWKPSARDAPNGSSDDGDDDEMSVDDDIRVEGTTAYLPPEVVMGAVPTTSSDSWALGCVLYQCLSGRPPLIDQDDEQTRQRIVSFGDSAEGSSDPLFSGKHAEGISNKARALIRRLLNRDAAFRPTMAQIAEDPFFDGVSCFTLHREEAPSLDVGSVAPAAEDSRWSRRQFSSIWAPQPKAYDLSGASGTGAATIGSSTASGGPIPEGDEANAFFTTSRQ
jgi:serine/threonine protein kinase